MIIRIKQEKLLLFFNELIDFLICNHIDFNFFTTGKYQIIQRSYIKSLKDMQNLIELFKDKDKLDDHISKFYLNMTINSTNMFIISTIKLLFNEMFESTHDQ